MANMVRVVYIGKGSGNRTYYGPATNTPYRFGDNDYHRVADVYPEDLHHFAQWPGLFRVEAPNDEKEARQVEKIVEKTKPGNEAEGQLLYNPQAPVVPPEEEEAATPEEPKDFKKGEVVNIRQARPKEK